jgi:hypothetical protein
MSIYLEYEKMKQENEQLAQTLRDLQWELTEQIEISCSNVDHYLRVSDELHRLRWRMKQWGKAWDEMNMIFEDIADDGDDVDLGSLLQVINMEDPRRDWK